MALPSSYNQVDPTKELALDETRLMRLAYEIAREIYPLQTILEAYGITSEIYNDFIRQHPVFLRHWKEGCELWHATTNVATRSRVKAGFVFESFLEEAGRLMHDPLQPMAPKVDMAKFLASVGEIVKEKGAVRTGDHVTVNINLGAGQNVVIDKKIRPELEGNFTEVPV